MPIFTFRCQECSQPFEIISQNFYGNTTEGTPIESVDISCPFCKSFQVFRTWSPPYVIYKTKGFYSTDNRKVEHEIS